MSPRPLLAFILAIYLLLAAGYGIASPPFETPDENLHYSTAEYIAREGRLPTTHEPGAMGQEAAQPPLYYAAAALLIRALDADTTVSSLWTNPRVDVSSVAGNVWISPLAPPNLRGESGARPPINANMFVRVPEEDWPWQGHVLAMHAVRLLSALLGLGTLLCIYGAGRAVWPHDPGRALLATALVAFLPQFAFIHAAVSNDAAITLFCAAALWQLLRIRNEALGSGGAGERGSAKRNTAGHGEAQRDTAPLPPRSPAPLLLLGLTIGLAMLSKAAGILLLAYCVAVVGLLVLLAPSARQPSAVVRRWPAFILHPSALILPVAYVTVPALLVGGWLLWRNWTLYGDPTAATQFVALTGGYRPYTLLQVAHDLDRVWLSFFAIFGWMSVQPPAWVHIIWNAIVLAAVVGGVWKRGSRGAGEQGSRPPRPVGEGWGEGSAERKRAAEREAFPPAPPSPRSPALLSPGLLLLGWFLLVAAGWLQFMLRTPADQGRLFFPALLPLAFGAAYGLSRWPRPWLPLLAAGLALATSVYCLLAVIPPAFARPALVAAVPAAAAPLDHRFAEGLDLLGVMVETPQAQPGQWVWITLYWRSAAADPGAPFVFLEMFGRDFARIGHVAAYHGRGGYPAALWPPGALVADRLAARVQLDDPAAAPVEAQIAVKLDEDADSIPVGTVKVVPAEWPAAVAPQATLGEDIDLAAAQLAATSATPGESVAVSVRWQVAAPPGPADLHLFVHLGDPAQAPLAQIDGPVMGGQYPPRLWAAGEVFSETLTLTLPHDLPPGDYPVQLGLYDFATGQRLPVMIDGARSPSDTFPLGSLTVP